MGATANRILRTSPILSHLIATTLIPVAYDYAVLSAIKIGIVGQWRATTAIGFFSLLLGIPIVTISVIHIVLSRRTGIGFGVVWFILLSLLVVFANFFFLGCHPIWEGRGMCS
jgi:hypothetical protein